MRASRQATTCENMAAWTGMTRLRSMVPSQVENGKPAAVRNVSDHAERRQQGTMWVAPTSISSKGEKIASHCRQIRDIGSHVQKCDEHKDHGDPAYGHGLP